MENKKQLSIPDSGCISHLILQGDTLCSHHLTTICPWSAAILHKEPYSSLSAFAHTHKFFMINSRHEDRRLAPVL